MSFSIQILKTGGLVVLTGGTIIASIIGGNWLADNVSKRLYKVDDTKENEIDEPNDPDEPYEYKFIDEYQKKYKEMMDAKTDEHDTDTETTKEQLENKLNGTKIHEITPKGDVIMYYDTALESFVYYCDDKSIPYKYLETVARKYSLDNDCLEIFVNMYDELKKGIERQKDAKIKKCMEDAKRKESIEESKQRNGDVFAAFKQYNKTNPKEMIKQRRYITKENANRYSYRGTIETGRNLRIENPTKKKAQDQTRILSQDTPHLMESVKSASNSASNNNRKISFSDFKRMQTSTSVDTLPVKTIEEWVESDNDSLGQNAKDMSDSPTFSPASIKKKTKQDNKSNHVEDRDHVEDTDHVEDRDHVEDASQVEDTDHVEDADETSEVTMNEEELAALLGE